MELKEAIYELEAIQSDYEYVTDIINAVAVTIQNDTERAYVKFGKEQNANVAYCCAMTIDEIMPFCNILYDYIRRLESINEKLLKTINSCTNQAQEPTEKE